jgi:Flp pilus assembly protein TadG
MFWIFLRGADPAGIFKRFRRDPGGNVAAVFAFSAVTLIVALGGAIDLARAYNAQQKLMEVATLACQYANRPSVIQTDANDYGGSNGQSAYNAAVTKFIATSLEAQKFEYTQTTNPPFTSTQNGPADVTLTADVPTTLMQIAQITQVPISASVHCFDAPSAIPQVVNSPYLVQETFTNPPSGCAYGNAVCWINAGGTVGPPSTPSSTFPSSPSFTGATGIGWYVTGYCLEIDSLKADNNTTDPGATHSAELDCDDGKSGPSDEGNSAITTKLYLETGNYELRYFYRARVDYPDYDPAYICGSTFGDVSWANDTNSSGGPVSGALRNNQLEVYLDQVVGSSPPLHTTIDGTQQLAGSNLIDVCVYGYSWIERSVRVFVSTPAYYWLTFAADGQNDSFGGQIDNIRFCQGTCPGTPQDNFPSPWLAANTGGANKLLFDDTFDTPVYSGTGFNNSGNMFYSDGSSGSASSGWPGLAASGWRMGPTNNIPYWNVACPQGLQCVELGWTGGSFISRPFLLDPGYYQVDYDYLSEITFAPLNSVYCGATPAVANIPSLLAQNGYGNIHYFNVQTGAVTNYATNTVGVFMSHAQLASTPNLTSAFGATTTYTNPDGTTSTTATVPLSGISLTNYNASQVNPLLDICGYAASPQARTAYILIQKPAYYWLTLGALSGAGYGGFIDDVRLTALGSPYMASPPANAITIPVPSPSAGGAVSYSSFEIVADPLAPPAAAQ